MTLTARETMQALLDGKTLECDHPWYLIKLDDKDNIVVCNSINPLEKGKFTERYTLISKMDRIYEEYPLNFEQALRAMLDGKVVEVRRPDVEPRFICRFNHEFSRFEYYYKRDDKWRTTHISAYDQGYKWKVVE